ncbi:MAG: rod shape-determining protein RodA [Bacteroidetes bacterium]|nr:rod shape-determining protein RodA [Bacteroidota bacterium]
MREQKNILGNIDWVMVGIYLLLVLLGWFNIYSAIFNENHKSIFDITQNYGKQLMWILTSVLLALFIMAIDSKFFSQFAFGIYGFFLLLLMVVLLAGQTTNGAKSWLGFGGFGIQPSEFAKFATNLALAKYLSSSDINIKDLKTKIYATLILLIPTALILLQNDTGSAIVYAAFILVLYREGLSGNILVFGLIAAILFILVLLINKFIISGIILAVALIFIYFIRKNRRGIITVVIFLVLTIGFVFTVDYLFQHVLQDHQRQRINVLLGKEIDLKGAGYNVNQSKIAIGSGGFWGKGYLNGTQTKFNFVPEQSTDFIFCTIGEEWGFLGSFIIVGLLIGLLIRIIFIAERQRSPFSRIYGYGVASILFMHIMVNIGMALGLLPVIGIPLPFFSYGGSSLWSFTILLFIFIKQDSYRLNLL